LTLSATQKRTISIGPEIPEAGSWNWVGKDLLNELAALDNYEAGSFRHELPRCDECIFVKWLPDLEKLQALSQQSSVIFCPIDIYGSGAEIDADWQRLRLCDRVIVHSPSLEKYFRGYAPTVSFNHHLKFTIPTRKTFVEDGPILWTGVWANLPPVVEWVNQNSLPEELIILTNFDGHSLRTPQEFGFSDSRNVCVGQWSAKRHLELLSISRAAIDIKGDDFRQRHKPPAKALDLIASGIPLAMNHDSISAHHLRDLGFEIPSPDDIGYWLSKEYWEKTQAFGNLLTREISRSKIMEQWMSLISQVVGERGDL